MSIDQLTIGDARRLAAMFGAGEAEESNPYTIGEPWFFRTVTHHLIGIVKAVGRQEVVLKGGTVQWVADDGRFSELFCDGGEPTETEPYGDRDVVLGRGSIVDATAMGRLIEVRQR